MSNKIEGVPMKTDLFEAVGRRTRLNGTSRSLRPDASAWEIGYFPLPMTAALAVIELPSTDIGQLGREHSAGEDLLSDVGN